MYLYEYSYLNINLSNSNSNNLKLWQYSSTLALETGGCGMHFGSLSFVLSFIGVARILSGGALFLTKKVDDLFFSRRPQRPSKYTSKSNQTSKNCPKNWLLLWLGGALRVLGGALTHFPCKLCLKNFSHRPGGCRCTHCTPWLRLCFLWV